MRTSIKAGGKGTGVQEMPRTYYSVDARGGKGKRERGEDYGCFDEQLCGQCGCDTRFAI
jgi:hypothetical protein